MVVAAVQGADIRSSFGVQYFKSQTLTQGHAAGGDSNQL